MMEKAVITALIGMFASVGYVGVADQADDILHEATVVAASMQERELTFALELYYLDHGTYPKVHDNDVATELYREGLLKKEAVPFDIDYRQLEGGRNYSLSVS